MPKRHFVVVVAVILALAVPVGWLVAQETPGAAATTAPGAQAGVRSEGPVPVPQPSEQALSYARSGNVLWVVSTVWGLFVPALLLFSGFSARMRNLAQRVGRKRVFTVMVYALLFTVLGFVLDLPLSYYSEFVRQHAYGLSNQTLGKWASDTAKGLMVSCIITALVLPVLYLFLRLSPRRWWLWSGLAAVPFIVLLLLVTPIWIEPLFNHFGPMKDKALEADILSLAHRAGIEGGRVFEVNKSVDTKSLNAYVTGFGQTKRIVLWDTLLARLDRREVLFVMGHEMGHYVLGHIPKLIAFLSLLILCSLYAAHRTAGAVIARWRERIGFSELSDVASLPLILLLVGVFTLVTTPIMMAYSREVEHEADTFGLEITRDNHAAATGFAKLQTDNLSLPRPGLLYRLWRSGHPTLGDRIDYANTYKPWDAGRPGRYGALFEAPRHE